MAARALAVRVRPPNFFRTAMSGARMAGIEDEKVSAEKPDERTVRRSWKGRAMTLLPLGAALRLENKAHNRRLSHCRRVYSIITWHSTSTEICERRSIADVS